MQPQSPWMQPSRPTTPPSAASPCAAQEDTQRPRARQQWPTSATARCTAASRWAKCAPESSGSAPPFLKLESELDPRDGLR